MELSRNLRVDSVSRLEPTPPRCVNSSATVREAVEFMRREGVGCLLVCENRRLVGIFTERDLLTRVLAKKLTLSAAIATVMTREPVVVQEKDSIRVAVEKMEAGGHRHLPVLDETQRPTGILSVKRVVHYLVEHFPATVYNLPPDPAAVPDTREGA